MIVLRALVNTLQKQKAVSVILFAFVFLSALLSSAGTGLIYKTASQVGELFNAADVPDFLQMHSGEIDADALHKWSKENSLISKYQIMEMATVDGSYLYADFSKEALGNGIMDISFVRQNRFFDFLLDKDNKPLTLKEGRIAVPIYYTEKLGIQEGDTITLDYPDFTMSFTVSGFLRDALMNPAIVHSKRFLVSDADYEKLRSNLVDVEYLLEYQLKDSEKLDEFSTSWNNSSMPKQGPAIDKNIFFLLSAISDGMLGTAVVFISLLVVLIALLCLRYTMLASIEEDIREIAAMKALGIRPYMIRRFFSARYTALALAGSVLGGLASLPASSILTRNLSLYAGNPDKGLVNSIIAAGGAFFVFLLIVLSCLIVLRRFRKISPVAAFQSTAAGKTARLTSFFSPAYSGIRQLPILLALRDLVQRKKQYIFLSFIFFFCTALMLIPSNFLTTISSDDFISYMGIGRADVRIDIRQSDSTEEDFLTIISTLEEDSDIEVFSPLRTIQCEYENSEGQKDLLTLECGDFSYFPLEFTEGEIPHTTQEIALSFIHSKEMSKSVGDTLTVYIDDTARTMTVSGIYQDITNGGRTAKAAIRNVSGKALWYTINIKLKPTVDKAAKIAEYSSRFSGTRITGIDEYLQETLGSTISRLRIASNISILSGIIMATLITSLFLKMISTSDLRSIAILKATGFSNSEVRLQYLAATLICLSFGIFFGTLFSNTAGESLVGFAWSFLGASQISLIINPLQAYGILPLLLFLTVSAAALVSTSLIRETSISRMIVE